ncbi:bifunctional endo-1,4-beta-xylanase XylA [Aphis gossypii]|uniref:Kazal-like domain-containing protein n=1 Tax=Aphis gossypii TaxID=80765 RepID=A0A9P0NCQ8_APHGO|nr:bifunctional endo-1,4-beta-xylanase XylA [Aphis gossypii]CAH1710328.1 unnamed protein product [Aphis gossypii]
MSACRLSVVFCVCFGLTVLSVYGAVPLDDIVFPESLDSRYQHSSSVDYNKPSFPRRTTRQGNRRPRPPTPNREDPFGGLDPQTNNQGGNQGQWGNVGNQRPNQQQGFNNRPSGQSQWGTNGNNPGQNQWGTNGNNPGQNQWGTNGNNPGQNQWGTNGNNPGQNQWGTNGNNPGQNQWGTNGNNPAQNQWGTNGNNPAQNQWGTNGNNPAQNQWGTNGNNPGSNPVQTSTTATNSEQESEAQRNTCNTSCREKITNEYNPVCGSDSQTYQNRRFLDCVANCGIPTEFSYIGTCVTTTERINRAL